MIPPIFGAMINTFINYNATKNYDQYTLKTNFLIILSFTELKHQHYLNEASICYYDIFSIFGCTVKQEEILLYLNESEKIFTESYSIETYYDFLFNCCGYEDRLKILEVIVYGCKKNSKILKSELNIIKLASFLKIKRNDFYMLEKKY